MKIGLIGWGVETKSAFNYFGSEHDYLIASEEPRPDFPAESDKVKVQFINEQRQPGIGGNVANLSYLNGIETCDRIIYTPIARKTLEAVYPPDDHFWKKAVTIQHIFFENVKTKNVIGVTGSKGKGTTSALITELLRATGKQVFFGGNVGTPVLDFINDVQADDWVVLELANFQLYKFPYSPHIAVVLMITEEHLDWHPDMDDYVMAKTNLVRHQTKEDITIYFADNEYSEHIAGESPGIKIPFWDSPGARLREDGMIVIGEEETEIIDERQLKLLGAHNRQNVCAALTAFWQVSQDVEVARKVLTTFQGLEHRLELVRELDEVRYYDDSFSTTPDTVKVALASLPQPIVLICGGHDKGGDYEKMAEYIVKDRVKHVIAIGEIAQRVTAALKVHGFSDVTTGLDNMTAVVNEARKHAQPGDAVLISCGTSSFGMFQDYKDRGDQFKTAVQALS